MPLHSPHFYLNYFLKRETTQLYTSVAIRNFAVGLILIFEPIYLYLYFGQSLSKVLLFFAAIQGFYGLLAPFGAKLMAKVGLKHAMLFSIPFLFGYYLSLFFLEKMVWLIGLAIVLKVIALMFFWPAFHTDFVRFSQKDHRGLEVGRLNVAASSATILSPLVGGLVLAAFGYPVLFTVTLIVLLISALPLFMSAEIHEVYTDSYERAFLRLINRENWRKTLAFAAQGIEVHINIFIWPLFMFTLAIHYSSMGFLTSGALLIGLLFTLYIGRLTDRVDHHRLLKIGAVLKSLAWLIKSFVTTGFSAFLAHTLYRLSQITAGIPFWVIMYNQAADQGADADEFIIYREIASNLAIAFSLLILALVFAFTPHLWIAFLLAAVFSLLLMLL